MRNPALPRVPQIKSGSARNLARSLPFAIGLLLILGASNLASSVDATPSPLVVMAAGDIACDPADPNFELGVGPSTNCRQGDTAKLLADADLILTLGDTQYECAGLEAFRESFDRSWGVFKSRIRPTLGNHEYNASGYSQAFGTDCDTSRSAAGYYAYFGAVAAEGAYSFDAGGWHFATVDSSCSLANCPAEASWLASDLAAHPATCSLVFYHHPRFSSGEKGDSLASDPFWRVAATAGVDLILNGHDHDYERFTPMDASGATSARGVREFVVGTGGYNTKPLPTVAPNSEVRNSGTFGVLKLTLGSDSYDWQFLPIAGQSFTDAGHGACR